MTLRRGLTYLKLETNFNLKKHELKFQIKSVFQSFPIATNWAQLTFKPKFLNNQFNWATTQMLFLPTRCCVSWIIILILDWHSYQDKWAVSHSWILFFLFKGISKVLRKGLRTARQLDIPYELQGTLLLFVGYVSIIIVSCEFHRWMGFQCLIFVIFCVDICRWI
jgi:hypothetical protein